MEHCYIAIDLKSFYASVECVERGLDPLTAYLVVADAQRTNKTICLAVSPALKAFGLSGRCRLFEVEQKVKEIKRKTGKTLLYYTAKPRMSYYMDYSSKIYEIYTKYISPEDIHVYSIDEVFMDVTHYLSLYKMSAHDLARMIIADVLATTGITATAGIAPNLYLCKVAMDIVAKHIPADKDGVRIAELDEMSYRKQLWDHQPLTDFWRVGKGISRRLENHGLYTMGDIALASMKEEAWFYKEFGIDAEILIDHAWGVEPCTIAQIKNYKPQNNSMTSGQVLSSGYNKDKALIVLTEMVEGLTLELVDKGLVSDVVGVMVGYDTDVDENYEGPYTKDFYGRLVPKPVSGQIRLPSKTSSLNKILPEVVKFYHRAVDGGLLVRRFNVSFGNLTKEEDMIEQLDLFSEPVVDEKEKNVQKAILKIKKKYGKNSIVKTADLQQGATLMDRNKQIGGHNA